MTNLKVLKDEDLVKINGGFIATAIATVVTLGAFAGSAYLGFSTNNK